MQLLRNLPTLKEDAIVILTGSSASGKTMLKDYLVKYLNFEFGISHTTRLPGEGEKNGIDYTFVTDDTFLQLESENFFAETNPHHKARYGTPKSELEKGGRIVLDLDVMGAKKVKALHPEALVIYVDTPSTKELERRLIARGRDNAEQIATRLERYKEVEKPMRDSFDIRIINKTKRQAIADCMATVFLWLDGEIVAIDGTSASGKGTIAGKIAKAFRAAYLDSGALYRYITLKLLELGYDIVNNETEIPSEALAFIVANYSPVEDNLLRTQQVNAAVAIWSKLEAIRATVFELQLQATYGSGLSIFVAEGRDMTSVIYRKARNKFFVTCPLRVRAKRRSEQNGFSVAENMKNLRKRDTDDRTRKLEPLVCKTSEGVIVLDNNKPIQATLSFAYSVIGLQPA